MGKESSHRDAEFTEKTLKKFSALSPEEHRDEVCLCG
jgi:hypothetical protein